MRQAHIGAAIVSVAAVWIGQSLPANAIDKYIKFQSVEH